MHRSVPGGAGTVRALSYVRVNKQNGAKDRCERTEKPPAGDGAVEYFREGAANAKGALG